MKQSAKQKSLEEHRKRELQAVFVEGYRKGAAGASLWLSDEINRLTDLILSSREQILGKNKEICQRIADRCGRDIYTATPGECVSPRGAEKPTPAPEEKE